MNKLVFFAAMLSALVLDASFLSVLEVGGVRPSALMVLVVFVCLCAEPVSAQWAAIISGFAVDLSGPVVWGGSQTLYLVGPNLLGFAFGAQLMLALRGALLKRSALAIAVATALFAGAWSLTVVAVWSARVWVVGPPVPWGDGSALSSLWMMFRSGLVSAGMAIPLGWLLVRSLPAWGFPAVGSWGRR